MRDEKTTRIAGKFAEELNEIKEQRIKNELDFVKISDRKITEMIPKHNDWQTIKRDIINFKIQHKNNEK